MKPQEIRERVQAISPLLDDLSSRTTNMNRMETMKAADSLLLTNQVLFVSEIAAQLAELNESISKILHLEHLGVPFLNISEIKGD